MSYISYAELNLEEISFIAGNTYTLEFVAYEEDGVTPLDLGGAGCSLVLCPYGRPDFNVLDITGTITDTNKFEIEFSSANTESLRGKYIFQPIIEAFTGEVYKPRQGVILVLAANARAS